MIWKDYLKLPEIASYSKLALASKAPPPPPPRRNRVKKSCIMMVDKSGRMVKDTHFYIFMVKEEL